MTEMKPFHKLFNDGNSAGAKLGWEHRVKDSLGFAAPIPGDKVFSVVPGIFGMPIRIGCLVAAGGKHVNITDGPTNSKRVGIGQAKWRVEGDPNIDVHSQKMQAKFDAEAKVKKDAGEAQKNWSKDATERSVQSAIAKGHVEYQPKDLKAGQEISIHQSPFDYGKEADVEHVRVNSPHEKWPDVRRVSDPSETPWTFGKHRITGLPTN